MKLEDRIIEEHKKEDEWHTKQIGLYHASEIYDICEGKLRPEDYFKPKSVNDRDIFNFWIGTMYHDAIQKMYPQAQKEVKIAIDVAEDAQIVGRCDMILDVPFELKTCSRFPVLPYDSHKYQFNCYLHSLKFEYGYITYILKSAQEIKTENYKVMYDADLQKYINEKVLNFHQQLLKLKIK